MKSFKRIAFASGVILICLSSLSAAAFPQTWTQLSPTGGPPPPRIAHTAVLDSLNHMIVFGGFPEGAFGAPPLLNDVWLLSDADGSGPTSTWTQLMPQGPAPAARALHTAIYAPATNSMIVFGGNLSVGNCFNEANDLWLLANANGVGGTPAWAQITPAGAPPSIRDGHSAVYDGANNRMIVFGGRVECSNANAEIWVLANANGVGGTPTWTHLSPAAGPAPGARAFHSAVYDSGSNRMIIFGGAAGTGGPLLNDVWVLANANGLGGAPTWTQLTPSGTLPPIRQGSSAVYNPATNKMTIFAGSTSIGIANDVWVLANANGLRGASAWAQLQPAGGAPVPRSFDSGVLNLPTDRMTVFGGQDSAGFGLNDAWVLVQPQVSATTTALTSSANPSVFGQPVTFTATVSPASGSGTPTGTVSFNDGAVTLATGMLSGGLASFITTSLSVGSHSITAVYRGDSNFTGSTSAVLTQTVNKASTTTVLTSSPNPSTLNQSVTFTANVSVIAPGSGTPIGTVTFRDGSTALATVTLSSAGTATFSTSALTVNSHSITAVYSGDGHFNGSSGSLTQQVSFGICVLYDQTKSKNSGAVFPIRVFLCDAHGNDVSSSAIVLHATQVVNISGFSGSPQSPGNANPKNNFRFDSTLGPSGGYIFNLSTAGLAPGTYSLQFMATGDPVTHSVNFGVK